MNFSSILSEIEKLDPEVYERTSERRTILKNWGKKVAMASLPLALGSLFNKAYGKSTASIIDILNFALKLEYLEADFYNTALASPSLTFPNFLSRQAIGQIAKHEDLHVSFLINTINSAGGVPIAKPVFDLTGGSGSGSGPFSAAFSNYGMFLAVAQTLEDTGVRAYKGAAPDLMSDNAILTAALNIHSVEARHASHIRQMRKTSGVNNVRPWITSNESAILPDTLVAANYDGEQNTNQANVDIAAIPGINGIPLGNKAASEAFDEPLTIAQVLTLVEPFIKP